MLMLFNTESDAFAISFVTSEPKYTILSRLLSSILLTSLSTSSVFIYTSLVFCASVATSYCSNFSMLLSISDILTSFTAVLSTSIISFGVVSTFEKSNPIYFLPYLSD